MDIIPFYYVISTYQFQKCTLAPLSLYNLGQVLSFLVRVHNLSIFLLSYVIHISNYYNLSKLFLYLFWLYSSLKQTLLISLISKTLSNLEPYPNSYKRIVLAKLVSQYGSILWWTIIPQFMLKQASLASCH